MGNIDSKYQFEHGNVYLQTDKAFFVAGEQITGNIYLNLSMGFPASSLEIEVKGKEKCKWMTRESKEVKDGDTTKNEFVDVWHKNDRKVITYKVPVYYFPGGMAPAGQYTFPFSFALPSNIPASIYYCGFDKACASIKYNIKAVMEPSIGFSVKKMKFKQTLIIRQPANLSALAPKQTDERNVYACCCFGNKGVASITTQFEKDAYTPEETCRAMCDIDNSNCSGAVNNVTIRLDQHVELRGKDGRTYTNKLVLEQKEYDGLAANTATGGMNRFLELSLANIRQQARPFDDVKPLSADELYLAERIQPTSQGNSVKLWYTLTVFCNYGTCCAEEPHCTIPLCITPAPLPNFGAIEAPPGWSPTVYNTFSFSLPGPGEVMAAAAQTVAPISGGISVNIGGGGQVQEEMKINMNVPPPTVGLSIDTDMINSEVPVMQPAPAMNVEFTGNTQGTNENINMNMNMGGMGMPGMNIDMQMDGNVQSNAAYTSETTVNGVTTSYTATTTGGIPPPMPVTAEMNIGGGIGTTSQVQVSGDDANMHIQANVGIPEVSKDINFNQ